MLLNTPEQIISDAMLFLTPIALQFIEDDDNAAVALPIERQSEPINIDDDGLHFGLYL